MAQKEYDDDDPMELIGVAFPLGEVGEMAEAIVEEFIKLGFDDEELLGLFRSPAYYTPHAIYRERGEEYVKALIQQIRERWGILRFTETRSFHQGEAARCPSLRWDPTVGIPPSGTPRGEGGAEDA